jgi:hypothetical protein
MGKLAESYRQNIADIISVELTALVLYDVISRVKKAIDLKRYLTRTRNPKRVKSKTGTKRSGGEASTIKSFHQKG